MPKAGLTRFRLRYFVVALVSVMVVASCSAQSLLASAATADLAMPANFDRSASGADLPSPTSVRGPAQPPDAPSAVRATISFNATKAGFEAPMHDDLLASGQKSYDQTSPASSPGKLVRMISGLMRRFDQSDLVPAQGTIHENPGLSGDTGFAVSRRLALIGAYQHNSVPSFDTMAFGVAFNFGGNTNPPSGQ